MSLYIILVWDFLFIFIYLFMFEGLRPNWMPRASINYNKKIFDQVRTFQDYQCSLNIFSKRPCRNCMAKATYVYT